MFSQGVVTSRVDVLESAMTSPICVHFSNVTAVGTLDCSGLCLQSCFRISFDILMLNRKRIWFKSFSDSVIAHSSVCIAINVPQNKKNPSFSHFLISPRLRLHDSLLYTAGVEKNSSFNLEKTDVMYRRRMSIWIFISVWAHSWLFSQSGWISCSMDSKILKLLESNGRELNRFSFEVMLWQHELM